MPNDPLAILDAADRLSADIDKRNLAVLDAADQLSAQVDDVTTRRSIFDLARNNAFNDGYTGTAGMHEVTGKNDDQSFAEWNAKGYGDEYNRVHGYYRMAREFAEQGPMDAVMYRAHVADKVPAKDRKLFENIYADVASRPEYAARRVGQVGRAINAAGEGMARMLVEGPRTWATELLGVGGEGAAEDNRFMDHMAKLRRDYSPNAPQGAVDKVVQATAGMLPELAGALATGGGSKALSLPTVIKQGLYWTGNIAPNEYREFREMGFDRGESRAAAIVSAIPQALIEQAQVKQFMPGPVDAAARKWLRVAAARFAKQYGKELGEEVAQEAVSDIALGYLDATNRNVTVDWGKEIGGDLETLAVAAGSLALLSAPGAAVTGLDAKGRQLLYDAGIDARAEAWRKGMVSDATARAANLDMAPMSALEQAQQDAAGGLVAAQTPNPVYEQVRAGDRSTLVTPEGQAALVESDPTLAMKVANATPSRKLGDLIPGANTWPKADREALVQGLRNRLGVVDPSLAEKADIPRPVVPSAKKQAWEMRRSEWLTSTDPDVVAERERDIAEIAAEEQKAAEDNLKAGRMSGAGYNRNRQVLAHLALRRKVRDALIRGETVPAEVLAQHPHTAEQFGYDVQSVIRAAQEQPELVPPPSPGSRPSTAKPSTKPPAVELDVSHETPAPPTAAKVKATEWGALKAKARDLGVKIKGTKSDLALAVFDAELEAKQAPAIPGTTEATDRATTQETPQPAPRRTVESPNEPVPDRIKVIEPAALHSGPGLVMDMENLSDLGKKGVNLSKRWWNYFFRPGGNMTKGTFKAKMVRDTEARSMNEQAAQAARDLREASLLVYKTKRVPESQLVLFNDAMRFDPETVRLAREIGAVYDPAGSLPKPLQAPIRRMRRIVDALSRMLIKEGVVNGDLAIIFDNNLGAYYTRGYEMWDTKRNFLRGGWNEKARRLMPQVIQNARDAIQTGAILSTGPLSDAEVEGELNFWLNRAEDSDKLAEFTRQAQNAGITMSTGKLQERLAIPKWMRDLWGEYRDPEVQFLKTVAAQIHMLTRSRFARDVAASGLVKDRQITDASGDFSYRLTKENMPGLRVLYGKYTTREFAEALRENFNPASKHPLLRAFAAANMLAKTNLTVLNPATHGRNLLGNLPMAFQQGWFSPTAMKDAASEMLASFGKFDTPKSRAMLRRLIELDVTTASTTEGELRSVINDTVNGDQPGGIYDKLTRPMTAAYHAEDAVFKIYGFFAERARYKKAMPHLKPHELDAIAADIVHRVLPNYETVPPGIQALRRFPILGTFTSFNYAVTRNQVHTIRQIWRELSDPRKSVKAIGAQRLAGAIGTHAILATLPAMISWAGGADKKDRDAIGELVPFYSEGHQLIPLSFGDGKATSVDLTYSNPWGMLYTALGETFFGKGDPQERGAKALGEILKPYLGESLITEKIVDLLRNDDGYGNKIRKPNDDWLEKAAASVGHVSELIQPGFVKAGRELNAAIGGVVRESGHAPDVGNVVISNVFGQRRKDTDAPAALRSHTRRLSAEAGDAVSQLREYATKRNAISDETLISEYEKADASRRRIFKQLTRKYDAAVRMGVAPSVAKRIMKDAGVADADIGDVIHDEYTPYKPEQDYLETQIKAAKIGALPGATAEEYRRRRNLIRDYAQKKRDSAAR